MRMKNDGSDDQSHSDLSEPEAMGTHQKLTPKRNNHWTEF